MARSEREAEVLASLNHANIVQIYGIEELVMEFDRRRDAEGPLDTAPTTHARSTMHWNLYTKRTSSIGN